MAKTRPWSFYELHCSRARMAPYLTECRGNRTRAKALYEWNSQVSAAFFESFGPFEVALRNVIDRQMTVRQHRLRRSHHWIFDDARELGRDAAGAGRHHHPYTDIARAMTHVRANAKPLTPDQILSELPFGFWHQIVSSRHRFLWPDLASGFPHAPSRNQTLISHPVALLRDLRNRISHHHRIWPLNLAGRYSTLLDIAGYIDPALKPWIHSRSEVPHLLCGQPPVVAAHAGCHSERSEESMVRFAG